MLSNVYVLSLFKNDNVFLTKYHLYYSFEFHYYS